jgi:hypothetical protein
MTYRRLYFTIQTLVRTGLEKINVLGLEEAQQDVRQIFNMCLELVRFWEGELTEEQYDDLTDIIAELPILKEV